MTQSVEGLGSYGDYSQVAEAVESRRVAAIAGQVATDSEGAFRFGEDPEGQVRGCFESLGIALSECGFGFANVLKFNTFVVGREMIRPFMDVRRRIFPDLFHSAPYPPNTLVIVSGLVDERFLIEIEALACQ